MWCFPSIFAFSIAPTRVAWYGLFILFIWSYVIIKGLLHRLGKPCHALCGAVWSQPYYSSAFCRNSANASPPRMPSHPLAEQGAALQPSPNQVPFVAGLGDAQEWDIPAPDPVPTLGGARWQHLSFPRQQGLGWALLLSAAKGSWMIQISDPASRFQRSGVQDCKTSADTAEQSASACA